ncbi:MAG: hypothetical protein ACYS5V_03990 [Planctomycetota bacterium]|jgi:hypothetical protein
MSNDNNGPTSTTVIGSVRVSRFIIGHNPPAGNSHISDEVDAAMRAYFDDQTVPALYRQAEGLGLRTLMIRGDFRMLHWVELYRRAGGTMNVIAQTASEMHDVLDNIRVMAAAGVEAIYHHGTQTDKFWREGRIDDCLDYLKCMRDCGVAVGLGTHQPEIIDYAVQHGWDVDFYMASFYNLSRMPRESAAVTGQTQYDEEIYVDEDRDRMCRMIRAVDKPVLAFKILAAGRKCASQEQVAEAFRFAYASVKPTDAIVVGLFPRDADELSLDLGYARDACEAV